MKMSASEWIEDESGATVDFSKLIGKIKTYWLYSLLCAFVLIGVAFIFIRRINPTYNAVATILIKDNDKAGGAGNQGSALASLQDLGLLQGASNVNNEQNIIKSYPLIEKVIKDLQLFLRFTVRKDIKEIPLYKESLPFQPKVVGTGWSKTKSANGDDTQAEYQISLDSGNGYRISSDQRQWRGKWNTPLKLPFGQLILYTNQLTGTWLPEDVITMRINDVNSVVDYYYNSLEAAIPDKQTSIINLSLPTTIPQQGVDILNALMESYQTSSVDDNNRFTDSTLSFINGRLIVVGDELDSIEQNIQKFKQTNDLADLSSQTQALVSNAGTYEQQIDGQKVQMSMVDALLGYMSANRNNDRVIPASLAISDATVSKAIDEYNRTLSQKERLLLSATSNHPVVKNLDTQLAGMKESILSGLQSIKLTLSAGINKMEQHSGSMTSLIRKVPAMERRFVDYTRQQSIKQELYLFLLQKREESLISKSSTLSNSRIITPGRVETDPIAPNKKLILSFALVLGLLLPFGIGTLFNLLNTKIKKEQDIKERTRLPIIGEIGHTNGEKFIVVTEDSRGQVAEQFRALRANLQFLFTNKDEKVILLTSSMSGEGKSFVATNLAMVFALAEKKVVLLEFDLRKPTIMSKLNMKYGKGLSNYIIGAAEISDIILPSGIHENLFLIPAGPVPPNPSELILHERTAALFQYLKQHFDYILIDTTPNLVSDAQLLANVADTALYLVRLNYTHKEQLNIADYLHSTGKLRRINLVVNDIKSKQYGGAYYGYGYGDYIEEEAPSKKRALSKIIKNGKPK